MIIEYHRPETLEQALKLLARKDVRTVPLGGGTVLNRPGGQDVAVVDLQSLGLDGIEKKGQQLRLGATTRLQALLDSPDVNETLKQAIRQESSYNLRQVGTVAGTLLAADGRSAFATAMLALDPVIDAIHPEQGEERFSLGNILLGRASLPPGFLIRALGLALNVRLAYQAVARTPADLPLVCAGLAMWPSGRTRLALGGYGSAPVLAFDGPESQGVEIAAENAYRAAGDQWASAEYRAETAQTLARRCLATLE